MSQILSKCILEIRFKANPTIVDIRGLLISKYSTLLKMPHWSLTDNRVDFFNKEKTIIFYISYNSMGVYIKNPPTENYFSDKSILFLKNIFDEDFMKDSTIVERFGIRTIAIIPFDGEFIQLKDTYLKKYINITPELLTIVEDEVYDIGCPITLESSYGKYNISCGPMKKEQILNKFYNIMDNDKIVNAKEAPEVGLYIDVDYWNTPKKILKTPDIIELVHTFSDSNTSRISGIEKLLIGNSYEK